jgi:DNA invertase Pin-like site-specific DNA recombinase
MKVALYARVSLDERADDKRYQEPENQLIPLRDWARALGLEVAREYIDRGSGANPARVEFRQMMNDALARRFSGILVWKLDRFSREGILPTLAYLRQLRERGIYLKSLTESWLDTQNEGITDVVLAIMAWAAAEERKRISERTKAGIARRRAIGQWRGGRPKKRGAAATALG